MKQVVGSGVKSGIRLFIFISTALLTMVVLAFTGILETTSFRQNYTHSLVSSYVVLAQQPVRKIEFALEYGKPLQHFYGLDTLLEEIPSNSSAIQAAEVVLPNGSVIASSRLQRATHIPEGLLPMLKFSEPTEATAYHVQTLNGMEYIAVPILRQKAPVASVLLQFSPSVINKPVNQYLWQLILALIILALLAMLVLAFVIWKISLFESNGQVRKRRILVLVLLTLSAAQIAFGGISYQLLRNGYLTSVKQNTELAVKVIREDIASVVRQGVPYSDLHQLGDYMRKIIAVVPEIQSVSIVNAEDTTSTDGTSGMLSEYTYTVPLAVDAIGESQYRCVVVLSPSYVGRQTREILLDTLTMLIVSFFLSYELIVGTLWFLRRQTAAEGDEEKLSKDRTAIRLPGFLVFGALYLTAAFVPLMMNHLYKPVPGLSRAVALALPISVEMLCTAVVSVAAGSLIDKKGWKLVFLVGIIIMGLGTLASALVGNEWLFILSRGLAGAGFGSVLVSMQNFVVRVDDEAAKNEGLNVLNAGAYAGINSGTVVGGMLGNRIGLAHVYYVSFLLLVLAFLFALRFLPNEAPDNLSQNTTGAGGLTVGRFLRRGPVLLFFLSVLLPVSVTGMFLYYFFPVFASGSNVSPADIGRAFLLNGLAIVYLGPVLARWMERGLGPRKALVVSGFLTGLAVLGFALTHSLVAATVVVVLMGVSDGFGVTSQINYFLGIREAMELGEGKAMGIYSLVENIGQMVGPILFGLAISLGTRTGISAIALVLLLGVFVFAFWGRPNRSSQVAPEIGGTSP